MKAVFPGLLAALPLLAQQPTPAEMPQEMVWVDRAGQILGRVGAIQNSIFFPELSPDGSQIAVSARDGEVNDRDIWLHDVATGTKRKVAGGKGNDNFPLWSPGGKSLIFTSSRSGNYDLYRKNLDPDRPEERIWGDEKIAEYPRAWSPEGRHLIYTQAGAFGRALYLLRLEPGGPASSDLLAKPNVWYDGARYSPDGRYIAYASNDGGPWEIWVCEAADPARSWKISRELANGWAGGGGQVRWRADGKELFYMMGNDTMMSVEVATDERFTHAAAKRLFALPAMRGNFPEEAPWLAKYAVAADGQRFVFVRTVPAK